MLSREQAESRLKAFQIKGWEKNRLAAMADLPKNLCEVGRFLLDRAADGKPFTNWQKRSEIWEQMPGRLAALSSKERTRLFAVLFPKLATHIEAAWQLLQRLPYELDYDRKGFRAPNDSAAHDRTRHQWLNDLIGELKGYDPDLAWLAAWAPYITGPYGSDYFGILFAAAIDDGGAVGDEVFTILKESASNEHEIGSMGRHVSRGLLVCARPDAWEFMEKMLLAAQRQEGLRQVILETIDEAHPQAFRRMLRLILEHNLLRFSATVRAVDTWMDLRWDSASASVIKKSLETLLGYLDDPAARDAAIKAESGEPLYLALWAAAFDDAVAAIPRAAALLNDAGAERRFVAAFLLKQIELPAARRVLLPLLDDPDLRVAMVAFEGKPEGKDAPDLWESLVRLVERMPSKAGQLPSTVWPWDGEQADRSTVAEELVERIGTRPVTALLPYMSYMSGFGRGQAVEALAKSKNRDAATREAMFSLVGDRDGWVREKALEALKKCTITEDDAQRVEALLVRKGSELRQGVIGLLKKQKTPQALASADRLLASRKAPQRLAGLELLRQLSEKKRSPDACRDRALAYQDKYPEAEEEEQVHIDAILDVKRVVPTLNDALGLLLPDSLSKPVPPQVKKVVLCSPATVACLKSLDDLITANRKMSVTLKVFGDVEEKLLGNVEGYEFPDPNPRRSAEQDRAKLPLAQMWEAWYEKRGKSLRDRDGLELLRASVWCGIDASEWKSLKRQFGKHWTSWLDLMCGGQEPVKLKHGGLVASIISWLLRLHPPAGAADLLLDAVETGFAMVPDELRTRVVDLTDWMKSQKDWRNDSPVERWWNEIEPYRRIDPAAFTAAHQVRIWQLLHWRDQPAPGVGRMKPGMDYLVTGFAAGQANEFDVYDHLLGPRGEYEDFDDLGDLTRPNALELVRCPTLQPLVDHVREAILQIELKRGELPTAATRPASALQSLTGMVTLFRLLSALGQKAFARQRYGEGRPEVLTHLISVTFPAESDTHEAFAEQAKQAKLTQERMLQLAFVAPQWLGHIEHALSWPGLREGVWWFLAHTPSGNNGLGGTEGDDYFDEDDDFDFDEDEDEEDAEENEEDARPLDPWERVILDRTSLKRSDRQAGAVDAAWFHRVFEPLGRRRWDLIGTASKYGCGDHGYKKAILLAEVLQGRAKRSELVANIRDRRLKDSVRLLGLLPLPEGAKREGELLARYKVLADYRRYARAQGPMSREECIRTATVGLENLARTAGYPDPLRLEWAMEAAQLTDLAAGPVSVSHEGVTVTLAIDAEAQPELTVRRGDKVLKSIPAAIKKHPKITKLTDRRTELKRSASRVKQSLEAAMIRGDGFSGREVRQLFSHPLLRPLLSRLVLIGEGVAGYPTAEGQALEDHKGRLEPIKPDETLRIAHPIDLYATSAWDRWQHDCFARERVQPFKQVFRELYLVTEAEKSALASSRYAGQQVNPAQARALWGSRGWRAFDDVTKTFHDEDIVAEVSFRHHGWTALEVEGLTLDTIAFRRRQDLAPIPLAQVPPRLFSEVMRDCDLVVSVAHRGGVDPEASASTVEMRAAILRETCELLGITNYRIDKHHVLIDGKLGHYDVHLGSAVVHRMPGGSLCIVPVHAQHRGRLFLPFADDDPRTAEVISKVLLLARDYEIQDPSILDQLR